MKALSPNLPEDLAISFYIQGQKLIFAAYQLTNVQGKYSLKQQTNKQTITKFFLLGTMKFDSWQADCSVAWLNEVLAFFTISLQLCQQLKDKVSVFSQYKDFHVDPNKDATESAKQDDPPQEKAQE